MLIWIEYQVFNEFNAWREGSWGPYIALREEPWPFDQTDLRCGRDDPRRSVEEASRGRRPGGPGPNRPVGGPHRSVGPLPPPLRGVLWCTLDPSGVFLTWRWSNLRRVPSCRSNLILFFCLTPEKYRITKTRGIY